ncbi:hypothetical protein ElyMa_006016300 [Elysia marginata]|uniref:Uncharacterized protein n=1 Tax=Elysia marginata TaxID=1093978 RepID=A0AAV4GH09_9GAST|nr:hypothetical protein ElyMa_006016300 [Elysia marginata]
MRHAISIDYVYASALQPSTVGPARCEWTTTTITSGLSVCLSTHAAVLECSLFKLLNPRPGVRFPRPSSHQGQTALTGIRGAAIAQEVEDCISPTSPTTPPTTSWTHSPCAVGSSSNFKLTEWQQVNKSFSYCMCREILETLRADDDNV